MNELRFVQQITDKPVKVTLPGPYLLTRAMWVGSFSGKGYGDKTEILSGLSEAELVATDPVAADIWSVTNILIPGFLDNGFSPPWPQPDATPDDPSSDFRQYLDASMSALLSAGLLSTNDLDQIDLHRLDLESVLFVDGFESGTTGSWSATVP